MELKYVFTVDNAKFLDAIRKQDKYIVDADANVIKLGTSLDKTFGGAAIKASTAKYTTSLKNLDNELNRNILTSGAAYRQNQSLLALRAKLAPSRERERAAIEKINIRLKENAGLINQVSGAKTRAASATRVYTSSLAQQSAVMSQLQNKLGMIFSIYAAQRFLSELIRIRGEFELQNIALTAMLQNKRLADEMFQQVVEMAIKSPFSILEMNKYLKQLKAYRIENEELIGTLGMLGDVSAGLGVSMDRLILAYGQVRAASVLRGQELRQFTEAGIPLVDQLAKKFTELNGVATTTAQVFDLISTRQVPFEMIKEIFVDMTKEGGIFYKQQILQSETLSGQVSVLRDSYDKMLNSLGVANEGILKGGIRGAIALVENYEELWAIINKLIIAYGVYKTIAIVNSVINGKISFAIRRQIILYTRLIPAINSTAAAMNALKLASGPILAILGLVAGAISAFVAKQRRLQKAIDDAIEPIVNQEIELRKLKKALESSTNSESTRLEIIQALKKANPELASAIDLETASLDELNKALQENIELTQIDAIAKEESLKKGGLKDAREGLEEAKTNINKRKNEELKLYAELFKDVSKAITEGNKDLGKKDTESWEYFMNAQDKSYVLQGIYATFLRMGKKEAELYYGDLYESVKKIADKYDLFGRNQVESQLDLWEGAVKVQEDKIRNLIVSTGEALGLSSEAIDSKLREYGLLPPKNPEDAAVEWAKWQEAVNKIVAKSTISLESKSALDIRDNEVKYKDYIEDLQEQFDTLTSRIKDIKGAAKSGMFPALSQENKELNNQLKTVKEIARLLGYSFEKSKSKGFKLASVDKESMDQIQAQLKMLKEMRDARIKLDKASEGKDPIIPDIETGFKEAFKDKEKFQEAFSNLGLDTDIFESFGDSAYDKTLEAFLKQVDNIRTDLKKKYGDAGLAVGNEFYDKMKEAVESEGIITPLEDAVKNAETRAKNINLRDKLLGEFAPFGEGFVFDVTVETTKAETDIKKIVTSYDKALKESNDSQAKALISLRDREIKAIREVEKERVEGLVEGAIKGQLGVLEQFYTNINEASFQQIKKVDEAIAGLAENEIKPIDLISDEQLKKLSKSRDEIASIFDAINSNVSDDVIMQTYNITSDELKTLRAIVGVSDAWNNKLKQIVTQWDQLSKEEKLERISEFVGELGSAISTLGEALSEAGSELGDILVGIGSMADTASKILSGIASGNAIQTAAAIIEGIAKIISAEAREKQAWKEAQDELRRNLRESKREYALWVNEVVRGVKLIEDEFGNLSKVQDDIFGVANPFSDAIAGANAYRDAVSLITEQSYKPIRGLRNKKFGGRLTLQEIEALQREQLTLEQSLNMFGRSQTGTKKTRGFLGIGQKTKATYGSLAEELGVQDIDIFSEEQLQKALASYDLLDDETKALVDDWEAYMSAMDEATQQITDSMSSLIGTLAGDWSDILVDGFMNGTNAVDGMRNSVEGLVESMLEQMMVSTMLSPFFNKLQKDMYKSMGLTETGEVDPNAVQGMGGFDQDWSDDIAKNWAEFDVKNIVDQWGNQMQEFKDQFQEFGLDLWNPSDEEKGLTRGIQSITEDKANIIAAYLNTIRHISIVNNGHLERMLAAMQNAQAIAAQQLTRLAAIEANTLRTADLLESFSKGTKTLKVA